jgi:hypothetical protein
MIPCSAVPALLATPVAYLFWTGPAATTGAAPPTCCTLQDHEPRR